MSEDQKFFDIYSVVVGGLMLFAFFILVLALKMGGSIQGGFVAESDEYRAAIEERIAPVGKVYKPGEDMQPEATTVEAAPEAEPVAAALSGPQVYNQACLACHGAGIGGAPVLGDADAWAPRIATGIETLTDHAINGYQGQVGYMPAKGGRADLSDEEVAAAVEYMVSEAS